MGGIRLFVVGPASWPKAGEKMNRQRIIRSMWLMITSFGPSKLAKIVSLGNNIVDYPFLPQVNVEIKLYFASFITLLIL